jgi:hypothetical protein
MRRGIEILPQAEAAHGQLPGAKPRELGDGKKK